MTWRQRLQAGLATCVEPEPQGAVPTIGKMDDVHLPAVERVGRRKAPYVSSPGTALTKSDLAAKLESATHTALDRAAEILEDTNLDDEDEKYGDKLRGLNAAIKTIVQTQVRVDEHRLKARKLDVLPELLEMIAQEERKRATV